ncbi:Glycoside hydrolase family 55 [Geosmithia morbida]|uniref:Glycoside hydrolase family 55 n=1 Tax=Geosmithia morbida TaxID=1094350 RepID=A0A9P5D0W8_9HYPO|nr:Glycoside hydrolase family 55 [Geosmithia morbida]KAF4119285.1 Glycoside hydrolase family 55 [Geosmithia morbida]
MKALSTFVGTSLLALGLMGPEVLGAATVQTSAATGGSDVSAAADSTWWFANIERTGKVPFGSVADDYPIFRNVKDYGATGDGSTDDTAAINKAITDGGNRCGEGCDSTTTTPALVYFPAGTYMVSAPLVQYYYTHMVGDLSDLPTLKATADFEGMAVIDANPYGDQNSNWFTNQNNFFRQIRNFKIDLTGMPMSKGAGIHWQVAQATSLQNIQFDMVQDDSPENQQQGIFMENGSGGFMTDLVFNGGNYGAFLGSQQFTARNLEFNNCKTAIYQVWNWVWNFHGLTVNGCGAGLNLTSGDAGAQNVGSVIVQDAKFSNTPVGILTLYDPDQTGSNGTLILDNVDFSEQVPVAVKNFGTDRTVLEGNQVVASWIQGRTYKGATGSSVQAIHAGAAAKPDALLGDDGKIFTRSKPQYADVAADKFISVKSNGAKGDGTTDDTAAIQKTFDSLADDEIAFFPHGAYIVTDTVNVPPNIKVVGEIWPLIMAGGDTNFKDQANPKPVFKVGKPGDVGAVEMSDLMLETQGPQPGAILMEWNVEGTDKGSTGLWDVHFRVGGSAGTDLQSDKCSKTPNSTTTANPECEGAFLMMHVTNSSTIYMENTWLWVSDHELDLADHNQINIYNGRGLLIESTKAAWLFGTASEHSVLYNYHLQAARNVYMTVIQTETAYFQSNPDANTPFKVNADYYDPDFSSYCGDADKTCPKTWGLRIHDSSDILFYGGGMYSFFENYDQDCLETEDCQVHMVDIQGSDVGLYGVSTKASANIISSQGKGIVQVQDNMNMFCATLAYFEMSS